MNFKNQRDYYFDNIKLLLITLVVIGHVIEPLINTYSNFRLLYFFIYAFHMPLFAFISGYFLKNANNKKNILPKISNIFIPYIIFQFFYSVFNIYVLKVQNFKLTFVYPYWITWYLLSLFTWNIIIPYFSKIKHCIIISILISVLSGYDNNIGYYLSLSRTITFFPYFLIGYLFKKHYIDIFKHYITRSGSVIALFFILFFINFISYKIDYKWFYGSFSYSQLDSFGLPKYAIRIFTYLLAIFISVFVLVLIPKTKFFFTQLGSRTMTVYLFHGFIIKLFIKYNIFTCFNNIFIRELLIISLSLLIVILLSSKIINRVYKAIFKAELLIQMK